MSASLPDLVALFDGLAAPAAGTWPGRFCAQPIPGFPACAVGKDAAGGPALLVQTDGARPGAAAPLVLEHLSVIHTVNCRVQSPAGEAERVLSVIRCTEPERAFHEFFLRSLYPVVVSLPDNPSQQQVSEAIERLADLFRQITQAPRKAVSGLWAELFVIARSRDPVLLVSCWHGGPEERFDFSRGPDRLDVKAASGGQRVHHFSLEQLRPPPPARVLITSLFVERSEGGESAADLVDAIRRRVPDPAQLARLDGVVARTIGQDWRSLQQARFDGQLAADSFRLVDGSSVPCVPTPLPPEVSGVHFVCDLTGHTHVVPAALLRDSPLFRAAAPA